MLLLNHISSHIIHLFLSLFFPLSFLTLFLLINPQIIITLFSTFPPHFYIFISSLLFTLISLFLHPFIFFYFLLFLFYYKFAILLHSIHNFFNSHTKCFLTLSLSLNLFSYFGGFFFILYLYVRLINFYVL